MRPIRSCVALLVVTACAGDSTDDPPDPGSEEITYWADVKPILDARCVSCHTEGEIAGPEDVVHDVRGDPRGFLSLFMSDMDLSGGFDIHSTMLHLHRLGREGRLSLHPEGDEEEVLVKVRNWDFDW